MSAPTLDTLHQEQVTFPLTAPGRDPIVSLGKKSFPTHGVAVRVTGGQADLVPLNDHGAWYEGCFVGMPADALPEIAAMFVTAALAKAGISAHDRAEILSRFQKALADPVSVAVEG